MSMICSLRVAISQRRRREQLRREAEAQHHQLQRLLTQVHARIQIVGKYQSCMVSK